MSDHSLPGSASRRVTSTARVCSRACSGLAPGRSRPTVTRRVPLEVMTASAEEAAAGIAELWLDGRLFATTRVSDDRRLLIDIQPGPWVLEAEQLHRALDRMAELLEWERPGVWSSR